MNTTHPALPAGLPPAGATTTPPTATPPSASPAPTATVAPTTPPPRSTTSAKRPSWKQTLWINVKASAKKSVKAFLLKAILWIVAIAVIVSAAIYALMEVSKFAKEKYNGRNKTPVVEITPAQPAVKIAPLPDPEKESLKQELAKMKAEAEAKNAAAEVEKQTRAQKKVGDTILEPTFDLDKVAPLAAAEEKKAVTQTPQIVPPAAVQVADKWSDVKVLGGFTVVPDDLPADPSDRRGTADKRWLDHVATLMKQDGEQGSSTRGQVQLDPKTGRVWIKVPKNTMTTAPVGVPWEQVRHRGEILYRGFGIKNVDLQGDLKKRFPYKPELDPLASK